MTGTVASAITVTFLVVLAIGDHGGPIGLAVEARLGVLLGQPLSLHVCLVPEVGEEHKEEGAIHPDEVDEQGYLVVTAVHEVILGDVEGHHHKLNQLDGGHVLLPPEELLEAWSSRRQAVVRVHDDVDDAIHHGMERAYSPGS